MLPSQYPRRVLIVVSGMSPQVLTETLFALTQRQQPAFVPTEVHLLSTVTGARHARFNLLEGSAHFLALCQDYQLDPGMFDASRIHAIRDAGGQPLDDIRSPSDNEAAADFITDFIRQHTDDENAAVHVSMAGGRKTMGYYAGYALSLYGRDQDRLSHVLVAEGFEGHRHFYYPTPLSRPIHRDNGPTLDAAEATVDLALIPFVRLRDELPEKIRRHNPLLAGKHGFSSAIAAAELARQPLVMTLDLPNLHFHIAGRDISDLGSANLSLLCWLADRQAHGLPPLAIRDVIDNGQALGQEYARFCAAMDHHDQSRSRRSGQPLRLPELPKVIDALQKAGFSERNSLEYRLANLGKRLTGLLGERLGTRFTPRNVGPHGRACYALEDFAERFNYISLSH